MSKIQEAFRLGMAYGMGRAWARIQSLAQDADKWITVKPNGEENKGRPVLIDGESGTIKGGMGGKFTGKNIRQNWKQNNKPEQKVSKPEQAEKPINAKALLNEERGLEQVFAAYKEDESLSREELTNLFMSDSVKGKEGLKDFLQTFYPDKYKRLARHIERWDPQKAEVWWYENVNEFEPESTYDNEAANKKLMEHYANNVPDDRFQEMSDRSQRENFSGSYHSNAWQHTKTNRYFGKNATFGKKEQNNGTNQQEGGAMKVSDDNWESASLGSVEDMLAYAAGVDGWANGAGPKGERLEKALFDQGYKSFHGEIDGKPVKVAYRNGQWRFKGLDPEIDAEPDPYQDRVMEVLKQLHENGTLKKGLPKKPKTEKGPVEAKPSAHPWMNNFGLEDHPDVQKALNRHKESSNAASRSRRRAGSEPADLDDDGYTMRQYLSNPQKSYDDLMKTVQWPKSFPEDKRKRLAELEAQTNFLQALVSGNDYERGHPVLKRYYDLQNEQRELDNELQEHFRRS